MNILCEIMLSSVCKKMMVIFCSNHGFDILRCCPDTPEIRLNLEHKHTYALSPTLPTSLYDEITISVNIEIVKNCIESFPKETSCGRDGLRAQHLLDVLCYVYFG